MYKIRYIQGDIMRLCSINKSLTTKTKVSSTITILMILCYVVVKNEVLQESISFGRNQNYSVQFYNEATRKFIDSLNCSLENHVAKYLLREPSQKPYSIGKKTYMYNHAAHALSWKEIHKFLRSFFNDQEFGFFLEAGALDGVLLSNTLWLEMERKWSGLLVEPNQSNYQELLKKNRKVWTANACLSTVPYPKISNFQNARPVKPLLTSGKDHDVMLRGHSFNMDVASIVEREFSSPFYLHDYSTALCLPIQYFLNALNISVVDFFSLDIEGGELQVLKLFPWDKVQLRTLVVESDDKVKDELINYMEKKGYTLIGTSEFRDYIFVLESEAKLLEKNHK